MRNRTGRWIKKLAVVLTLVIAASLFCPAASAEQSERAENIMKYCTLRSSQQAYDVDRLRDGLKREEFVLKSEEKQPLEQFVSVDLNGRTAKGIYITWGRNASPWSLEATLTDGSVVGSEHGRYGFLQEYVELPENTASFRIITRDGAENRLRITEVEVYSQGELPESVHSWEPTPTTAEIMYVATHQDDEILFLGGAIAYYSGELDYDSVMVYTAYESPERLQEALNGLWACGLTQYPVFLRNPELYCETIDDARKAWDEEKVTASLTALLLGHRPQVVVSQDVDGEQGNAQHVLTVQCVLQALRNAADKEYVSANFADSGVWAVNKCYLHLYGENNISMPWDTMAVTGAEEKTVFQVARDAYKCHASQRQLRYDVTVEPGNYDCRSFGLYSTQVGPDAGENDFFENITLRYEHVQPPADRITGGMEPVGSTGWLYRNTDSASDNGTYMRYCRVNGVTGWFPADYSGCLIDSAVQAGLLAADCTLDLSLYDGLEQIGSEPPLYRYSGSGGQTIVRYCSVGECTAAFYAAEEDGSLVDPLTIVDVAGTGADEGHAQSSSGDDTGRSEENPSARTVTWSGIIFAAVCALIAGTLIFIAIKGRGYAARGGSR